MVPLAKSPEHPQAPIPKLLEVMEHPGTVPADREPSHLLARQFLRRAGPWCRLSPCPDHQGLADRAGMCCPPDPELPLRPWPRSSREGHVGLSAYNFKELRASRNQEQMAGIGQLQNLP